MATLSDTRKKKRAKTQKRPDLSKVYRATRPPLRLEDQQFRISLLRPDAPAGAPRLLPVDGMVQALTWRAEPGDPVLQGDVTMKMPDYGAPVFIHYGHVLILEVEWAGKWRELWRMRLYTPDSGSERTLDNTLTFQLFDDMKVLQESTDYFHFTKSKKKPHGWKCHEVLIYIAQRYRIPLGKIVEGKHYITGISGEMSPMQAIQRAYAIERRNTGQRFIIAWRGGKLNVTHMRRNNLLYILKDAIEQAAIGCQPRDEKFATAVTLRGTLKTKGHKKRKIVRQFLDEGAIAREGFVHKMLDGVEVKDDSEADLKVKRYIANHAHRKRTLTGVTHRGIAFIRRGDAIGVDLPQFGFTGKKGICFVASGEWQLNNGDFTMSLDLTFDDPYVLTANDRKVKDKKTRAKKRASTSG